MTRGANHRPDHYSALYLALRAIFQATGSFRQVVAACCRAQRELAAEHSAIVRSQGWIVGKADNPHT